MFPLGMCHTCVHRNVCKYIDAYNSLEEQLPIDFSLAECLEYLDENGEDNIENEEKDTTVWDMLLETLQKMHGADVEVIAVTMNLYTYKECFGLEPLEYSVLMYEDKLIGVVIDPTVPNRMWDFLFVRGS